MHCGQEDLEGGTFAELASHAKPSMMAAKNSITAPAPNPRPVNFVVKKGSKARATTSIDIPAPVSGHFQGGIAALFHGQGPIARSDGGFIQDFRASPNGDQALLACCERFGSVS